jgi:intracellular sulfur oxidation DsrE/DsrF family protein
MRNLLIGLALAASVSLAGAQAIKTVYHINTGIDSAAAALNNIQNHLNADPTAKIVVVTHSSGIEFMIQGAKDSKGREFSSTVSTLAAKGVDFRVCNNTLVSRKVDPGSLLMEAVIVPSGVAEVAMLQAKQGFVYLKP